MIAPCPYLVADIATATSHCYMLLNNAKTQEAETTQINISYIESGISYNTHENACRSHAL